MSELGVELGDRHRVVAEPRIVEELLVLGWPDRLGPGERPESEREARATIERAVRLGLACRRDDWGRRLFDPAELYNFLVRAGLRGEDSFWHKRSLALRAIVAGHGVPAGGVPAPERLAAAPFEVDFTREFNLAGHEPGEALRLRLALPIEDAALTDLAIAETRASTPAEPLGQAPGRLDFRVTVPPGRRVSLGATLRFVARPTPAEGPAPPLDPEEEALYTRPREGIIRVNSRIRELATTLGRGASEPWERVQRYWSFLLEELNVGILHYPPDESAALDRILDTGWTDCHRGAALFAALCRASRIPARLVGGHFLYPALPSPHFWAEAWLPGRGWLPFDLFASVLSQKGRDRDWRDCFRGWADPRMKTQCLPRIFTGTPGLRFPPEWYMIQRPCGAGIEIGYYETATGEPVHIDRIAVRRLPA